MMTSELSVQLTQIIFYALLAIPSLIVLGGVVYVAVIVTPTLLKQMQQLIDNNKKLTEIGQQNADQIQATEKSLVSITPELIKQTNSIETQTLEVKGQRLDLKNYNTLVIETVANHATHMEANTAMMARFEATMNGLPEQIRVMIDDALACQNIEQAIRALRAEVMQVISQQQNKRVTGTIPIVATPTEKPSTP